MSAVSLETSSSLKLTSVNNSSINKSDDTYQPNVSIYRLNSSIRFGNQELRMHEFLDSKNDTIFHFQTNRGPKSVDGVN